jgi:hypothetical protein
MLHSVKREKIKSSFTALNNHSNVEQTKHLAEQSGSELYWLKRVITLADNLACDSIKALIIKALLTSNPWVYLPLKLS